LSSEKRGKEKRVKRFAAALLAIAALALTVVATVSADATGDTLGKACSDIVSGTGGYTGTNPTNGDPPDVVIATVNYAAPTCQGVAYTLLVYDESGTNLLGFQILRGDGSSSSLDFQVNNIVGTDNGDGTQSVCLATVTSNGFHILDRAPDTGCGVETSGGSGGGGGTFG
jgi:hypothetical protein